MAARVFVHGAGRGGRAAWPRQQEAFGAGTAAPAVFVDWPWAEAAGSDATGAARWLRAHVAAIRDGLSAPTGGDGHGHVVAHSHGALAAVAAARYNPAQVRSLALFEPACFGLARGRPAVEAHIDALDPVLALAPADADISDDEYRRRFLTALGAPAPPPAESDAERTAARRLRSLPAPWSVPLEAAVFSRIPVLVVTGGWSDLYEQTAASLAALGARHRVLAGHGHRPQDHPDANHLLRELPAVAEDVC